MSLRLLLIGLLAVGAIAASIGLGSKPARAADLAYFYCYAPNPETGTTYISDVHPVGPVAERRGYGDEFAAYLRSKGLMREVGVGFCVMRATMREIDSGRSSMAQMTCQECAGAERMEDIDWPREGATIQAVLVGKGPRVAEADNPNGGKADQPDKPKTVTVTVYVREDALGAFAMAEPGSGEAAKQNARFKGGMWRALVEESSVCTGWWAVSYAQSKDQRHYWMQGSDSEAGASARALKIAEAYANAKGDGWTSGIAVAFLSPIDEPEPSAGEKVMDYIKGKVRESVTNRCPERGTNACMCVRG